MIVQLNTVVCIQDCGTIYVSHDAEVFLRKNVRPVAGYELGTNAVSNRTNPNVL
jgi:hypothetical protein